jgi:hypothetical protein
VEVTPRAEPGAAVTSAVPPDPGPPTTQPEDQKPKDDKRDGWRLSEKLLGLLTAILTLAAATFGFLAAKAKAERDDVEAEAAQLADDLGTANDERDDLSSQLEEANGEVERLEQELTDATATTTATGDERSPDSPVGTSPPTTTTSTVRRQTGSTPLTFTWTYSVDLDSQDADWAVEGGSPSGWDLYLDGGGDVSTREVVIFDHVPSEAECRDATVRQPGLEDEQSTEGAMMCVQTSEDRFAFVRIVGVDEERRTTSVDIVVWE